ncbi:MAG: TIGR03643 family protein [Saprospiraceae bacterium]
MTEEITNIALIASHKQSELEVKPINVDRVIEMAWEDRTPFEAIEFQFGLKEAEVVALMRKTLKRSSFNLWRKRVHSGVSQKHLKKRLEGITRFKCKLQRAISSNKISKR